MVEYEIVTRGEGFVGWIEGGGYYAPSNFKDLLTRTPEPLLAPKPMEELFALLDGLPTRVSRWRSAQRQEGARLASLIEASDADAVVPEARKLLCELLRGRSILARGRPKRNFDKSKRGNYSDLIAHHVLDLVVKQLTQPALMNVPFLWRPIPVYEDLMALPLKERALQTTHRMLLEAGIFVPSVGRLRNRLSAYRVRQEEERKLLSNASAPKDG